MLHTLLSSGLLRFSSPTPSYFLLQLNCNLPIAPSLPFLKSRRSYGPDRTFALSWSRRHSDRTKKLTHHSQSATDRAAPEYPFPCHVDDHWTRLAGAVVQTPPPQALKKDKLLQAQRKDLQMRRKDLWGTKQPGKKSRMEKSLGALFTPAIPI